MIQLHFIKYYAKRDIKIMNCNEHKKFHQKSINMQLFTVK